MPRCTRTLLTALTLFAFALFWGSNLQAQLRQPYSGPLKLGSYQGNANYTYKVVGADTLLDGTFQMKRSNLEALLQKSDSSFSIVGSFKDNHPNGDWRFQFGEFKSDSTTQVVDYQYKLNVDGVQNESSGQINMGKPNGTWRIATNQIKNSEIVQTLFKSTITFDNGVPQKNFQIENASSTLVGRFLRDGLAHDEWTLYSDEDLDAVESWQFSDGWLRKIESTINGQKRVIEIYPDSNKNSKVIKMDSRYFQVLRLKVSQGNGFELLEQNMNALLIENAAQYKKINALLSELGNSSFYPDFKVRVEHYPLDSIEMAQLDSIAILQKQSKKIVDGFLGNTQLNILKLSDQRADYLYNATKAISEQFVEPMGQLVNYKEDDIFDLISRKELINSIWKNGMPSKELVLDDGSNYTGPKAEEFAIGEDNLGTIVQMARYTANSLKSIETELNDKLAQDKRQQEYVSIEEQLIAKRSLLNREIDSALTSLSKEYGNALKSVQNLADERLAMYSNMQEGADKLELGRKLVTCFDKLDSLAKAVIMQPERSKEIEEKYLDAIWNPFMATIMNEEVKKRITAAYRKVLIPYLLEQTSSELSCKNAAALITAFDETHERMGQLRDEDTHKLERKLKREQDPSVVMQLFNLQPLSEN